MASPSPPEPYPIDLPLPDALPPLPPHLNNIKNLNSALKEGTVPPSIDVHIRWVVETGSIVHVGEKIAELYYSFHGTSPPTPNRANKNKKKQRGDRGRKRNWNSNDAVTLEHNLICQEVRSPAIGFLRVLYKNPLMLDAVQITLFGSSGIEMSASKLILAAIEPCEHPAVVGGLCVVCGVDPRTTTNNVIHPVQQSQSPRKKLLKDVVSPRKTISWTPPQSPDSEHVKKRQILEKQKQVATLLASSASHDAELANLDLDAATKIKSTNTTTKSPQVTEPGPKPTAKPTTVRSLSSLLSGATATRKLQESHPNQSIVSQQRHIPTRPRQTTMSLSTNPNADDNSNMSKMTVSGGVTIAISESEAKSISEASSKKLMEEKKLCLVLDLDHTLLHATDDYRACRFVADELLIDNSNNSEKTNGTKKLNTNSTTDHPTMTQNPDKRQDVRSILLPVELHPSMQQQYVQQKMQQQKLGGATKYSLSPLPQQRQDANGCIIMRHFVKLRPYLKEFFAEIQSTYQLSIYTAGTRAYAEQVALMICRHIVGARLDEEGLNELRGRVKHKDDEVRRYMANIERLRQLQLAKASMTVAESNKSASPKKSVSFGVVEDSGKTGDQDAEPKGVDSDGIERSLDQKQQLDFGRWSPPVALESGDCKVKLADKEQLVDPSEERDQLRQELEESEDLELQAVDLRRKLFGSRIVSRTDVGDLGKDVKSLKRVFPCGGVMVSDELECCGTLLFFEQLFAN